MATTVPAARPAAYPHVVVLAVWQRLTLTLALVAVQRRDV
jgi:hypothetical protein